jgi:class 3 adenylate cyclase
VQCPRCGRDNPIDTVFCDECGARVNGACPACRAPNRPGAKFCRVGGQPLLASNAISDAPRVTPESYTPQDLADRILTSRAALEGERKQVTVLFADLKGSMELLADRDPEEARTILDPVLQHMMDAVHRFEGTVNQVMGDGIMALFGAPLAHEDHALRACYAALDMQERVKRYAEAVRRSEAAVVKIRVGLNSGEVVVRAIGSDLRMDYTAVGQTTHLAARMEQLAEPGTIVIAPDTHALVEGHVDVKSLGSVRVRGLAAAVEVHELMGAGRVRTRLQVLRGARPFRGCARRARAPARHA